MTTEEYRSWRSLRRWAAKERGGPFGYRSEEVCHNVLMSSDRLGQAPPLDDRLFLASVVLSATATTTFYPSFAV